MAAQYNDDHSLLRFMQHLTARYRVSPEIGWGQFARLPQDSPALLVHSLTSDIGRLIAVHNFADTPTTATIRLDDEPDGTILVDLLGPERHEFDAAGVQLEVAPYDYRWLRVSRPGDGRLS